MRHGRKHRWKGIGALLLALGGCGDRGSNAGLSPADTVAIAAVQAAYVKAWLADDTTGVLATLDSNAILLPPGRDPVLGHTAIRAFWWPDDGSHTQIREFTWDLAELMGDGRIAVARGLSTVGWTYAKDTVRTSQTVRNISLSVLQRSPSGEWRIARQMWGPALR